MIEASRVQKLLTEQNDEINRLRNRIEKLEAALRDLSDGWECCAVSKAMRSVARKALEGKDD
jgi:cell division protein FtsB